MRPENISDNCIFAFSPETEPLFGVYSLLAGEEVHHLITDLYGEKQVAAWKKRYRFLFETCAAVRSLIPFTFMDILLDVFKEGFTAEGFRDYILSLPEDERVFRQAEWGYLCGATQKDIKRALKDDDALDELYSKVDDKVPSFLGFTSFVRQSKRYYEEYFALANDLDTPLLRDALKEHEKDTDAFRDQVISYLDSNDGLECSQKLMGKTFHNRGPYEQFWFLPSLLLPGRCCRFFYDNGRKHNKQILFCSIREPEKGREDTIAALKALSDETRYQILMFLAKNGPVNGQDIARKLKLAPSTVSHHMTELKERGLITEEPVRTAKYYGISKKVIGTLLKTVESDLKL